MNLLRSSSAPFMKIGQAFKSPVLIRDMASAGTAGIVAGLVFWLALRSQGMLSTVPGLFGLDVSGTGVAWHLLAAALMGAVLGTLIRYQPSGYAPAVSSGALYGLVWWIVGPLTLGTAFDDRGLTWSLVDSERAFPSLIGHLLYGSITALGFHIIVAIFLRIYPEKEPAAETEERLSQRVLILGGGFGGMATAQRLEQIYCQDPSLEIVLVSQNNYLLFTPMLAEVASSALEAQHISAPVRASCPQTRFYHAEVGSIDSVARTISIRSGGTSYPETLAYDRLVLALGSIANYYNLPGLEENSFKLKSLEDATTLRNHVISLLERADVEQDEVERRRQLTLVVVGGGFAGTEAAAELFDLTHSVLRYYPGINEGDLRIVLIHSRDRILPELSSGLGDYALRKLQQRGIEFMLGTRVTGATTDAVLLADQEPLETDTLVWTAGSQPNPILAMLPCLHSQTGAVLVDSTLRVDNIPDIWAVGDCAQIPDPDNPGQYYPPTAQHALREGKLVAENIAASFRGQPAKSFRFRALGILVGLGHRTAAAEIRGWRFSGLLAWFMWRSIYLGKLPGMEKKLRVALDWVIDLFFPRDIVLTSTFVRPTRVHDSSTTQDDPDRPSILK